MIDVYFYVSEVAREKDHHAEAWRRAPAAPRVGDRVYLRADLKSARRVAAVYWYDSKAQDFQPARLHAYVVLEPAP